jgi:hypothetical protein
MGVSIAIPQTKIICISKHEKKLKLETCIERKRNNIKKEREIGA